MPVPDWGNVPDWWSVLGWWDGFAVAFVLTCVIELPVYLVGCRWIGGPDRPDRLGRLGRWPAVIATACGLNCVTHPLFWAYAHHWPSPGAVAVGEVGVVVVEGVLLGLIVGDRRARCLIVALVANATSALLGSRLLVATPDIIAALAGWSAS